MSHSILEPGMFVRHPHHPGWGVGQVQSRVGSLVTVNFPDEGKKVINGDVVTLEIVYSF
ncbi:MAG: DUF3553 domain-containing protein [Rhodobacteraceae bacterium]|nr:DUF3553 domain-containing protein [Paracoccaceae bacterium]